MTVILEVQSYLLSDLGIFGGSQSYLLKRCFGSEGNPPDLLDCFFFNVNIFLGSTPGPIFSVECEFCYMDFATTTYVFCYPERVTVTVVLGRVL